MGDTLIGLKDDPDQLFGELLNVPAVRHERMDFYYVVVADGTIGDFPGVSVPFAKRVVSVIGPVEEKHAEEALQQVVNLLIYLGVTVKISGKDF